MRRLNSTYRGSAATATTNDDDNIQRRNATQQNELTTQPREISAIKLFQHSYSYWTRHARTSNASKTFRVTEIWQMLKTNNSSSRSSSSRSSSSVLVLKRVTVALANVMQRSRNSSSSSRQQDDKCTNLSTLPKCIECGRALSIMFLLYPLLFSLFFVQMRLANHEKYSVCVSKAEFKRTKVVMSSQYDNVHSGLILFYIACLLNEPKHPIVVLWKFIVYDTALLQSFVFNCFANVICSKCLIKKIQIQARISWLTVRFKDSTFSFR